MNGFSQIPYDRIKFYWRIKKSKFFFILLALNQRIDQKMTRDFEIHFENKNDLIQAKHIIENAFCDKNNNKIFGDISVKELSLFASLSYPYDIKTEDRIFINNKEIEFSNVVSFVAIKNAMHSSKGEIYFSKEFYDKKF